jgi:arylsulfatase A-like enzyme
MLEYMDDVLGRLFDYMDSSPFKEDTYVMVMSDNGSELFLGELPKNRVRNVLNAGVTPASGPDAAAAPTRHKLCSGTTSCTNALGAVLSAGACNSPPKLKQYICTSSPATE